MPAIRIDHTAIAVRDMDEALSRYERLLGLGVAERAMVPAQRVEVAFLNGGPTKLELICPTDTESGVARFLDKRGEGLHHIGVLVSDVATELERLAKEGIELIDRKPRPGLHGQIAFIHPRGSGGVLIELIEQSY